MHKLKIGIVGCGAIGSSLARVIAKDLKQQARLCALYDLEKNKAWVLSKEILKRPNLATDSLQQLIQRSELVIEAASAKSSWDIARMALCSGNDIMIMSVGGVASHIKDLTALAKAHKVRVYIPSGAICGIDGLKAASTGKLKKVVLTTTKNPLSFRGVKYIQRRRINLDKIKKEKVLFYGSASSAIRHFPQNINVAALLSLAGLGLDKTRVKIIASAAVSRNMHEVRIESVSGNITTRTENILHPDNPKTSYLAVLSAIAVLRQIFEPVKIGT